MTEHIRAMPDLTDATWCDGVVDPDVVLEPDPGVKAAGYNHLSKPPHEAWNWIFQFIGYVFDWLRGNAIRRFPTLAEGIAATAMGDEFRVHRDDAAVTLVKRGDTVVTVTTAADPILGWCADGAQIYVLYDPAAGDGYVRAYSAITGAQVWSTTIETDQMQAICCDGDYVFACGNGYATQLNATTGAIIDSIGLTDNADVEPHGCAANGYFLCAIGRKAAASATWFLTYDGTGMTQTGNAEHGATASSEFLHAICVGATWVAVTGVTADTVAGDKFFHVYDLDSRTEIASIDGKTTYVPDAIGWALATDGDHLFLGSNHTDPTGASYESSFWVYGLSCPDATPSAELIQIYREPSVNGLADFDTTSQISTDGTYVAFADSTETLRVYRVGTWSQVIADNANNRHVHPTSCDGWLVWYEDSGNDIKGMMIHPEGRRYVRGYAGNFAKFPVNYSLAQPR